MRKIIVSIHSSFNGVVTCPAHDETNFMSWAQPGIDDSGEAFRKNLEHGAILLHYALVTPDNPR